MGETALACNIDIGRAIMEAEAHHGVGGPGTGACSATSCWRRWRAVPKLQRRWSPRPWASSFARSRSTSKAISTCGGRWGSPGMFPWALPTSACASKWTETSRPDELASFQRKVERYCVVLSTLRQPPTIHTSLVARPLKRLAHDDTVKRSSGAPVQGMNGGATGSQRDWRDGRPLEA